MVAITIPFHEGANSEIGKKLVDAYCWGEQPVAWVNAEAIAEMIGVEKTRSNLTAIGIEVRKLNAKTRRTNSCRLIAVPKAKIEQ